MKTKIFSLTILLSILSLSNVFSQSLTGEDYTKALWMTARMYGGQRSGDGPNWLIMDHTPSSADASNLTANKSYKASEMHPGQCFTKDADGSYSLEGGWVDCGDHVKFGQTFFYAAYTLIKGYAEFPEGYDDYYSYDYNGYQAAGDFSWEGGKGSPNGIPDILDELKYQTDFLIKCARNSTTFYSQVGDGDLDHKNWVTSVAMAALPKSEGGQNDGARSFVKNPNDCSMASNCAATLAVMARVYEKFDPTYAALCLTHAKYAYDYAKSHQGSNASAGSFYPANVKWQDDYASACAEMYWSTNDNAYKTEALSYSGSLGNHNWCYNYNNNDDVAAFNLAKLGDAASNTLLTFYATTYKAAINSNGVYNGAGNTWGALRYPANASFIVALWQDLNNATTVDPLIANSIDYILGKNTSNFSFVVGYSRTNCGSCSYAVHPHHRNVYLIDNITANQNSMVIPTRNKQHGYLIGGNLSVPFTESAIDYQTSEGGIDYNAGLVGALGYIVSRVAPIDPNKFGHPTPELGPEQTLCGTGSVTLTATVDWTNLAQGEQVTYKWYNSAGTLVAQGDTKSSLTVTTASEYTVKVIERSSAAWETSDKVVVSATLPTVDLGADVNFCTETSKTLDAGVSGTGITYQWKKNTTILPNTTKTLDVISAGTYTVTVSASGCTSKTDNIVITSSLPNVTHDTICSAGQAILSINTAGSYQWYSASENGTLLSSNSTYSPTISTSTTYYVQDASSVNGSVGPTSNVGSGTDWGISANNQLHFSINNSFKITSLKVNFGTIYNAVSNGTITIEILNSSGASFSPAKTFTSDGMNITTGMSNTLVEFTFSNLNIDLAWGADLRMRLNDKTVNGGVLFNGSGASFPYNSNPAGVVSITGASGGSGGTAQYMYFYDWKISAGSSCARTPVLAVIDPTNPSCIGDTQAPTTPGTITFGTTNQNSIVASWTASTDNTAVDHYEIYVDGSLYTTSTTNSVTLTGLTCGQTYAVKVNAVDAAGNTSAFNTEKTKTTTVTTAPTVTSPISYNVGDSPSALTATGTNLLWYTAATGGTGSASLTPSTASAGSTTYYVTQTVNGCESSRTPLIVNVTTAVFAQTISLSTGWNLISLNILPTDASIDAIFSSIMSDVDLIKNADGFYKNGQASELQSLTTMELGKGYLVKMNSGTDLVITGAQAGNVSVNLAAGWNMLGYPLTTSTVTTTTLSGIWSKTNTIKNFDGFKDQSSGTMNNLTPGEGYYIYMNTASTLNY